MAKDSKGHGSNAMAMRKLDATPWNKLTPEQQGQLRAHKQAVSEKMQSSLAKQGVPYRAFPTAPEMAGMARSPKSSASSQRERRQEVKVTSNKGQKTP